MLWEKLASSVKLGDCALGSNKQRENERQLSAGVIQAGGFLATCRHKELAHGFLHHALLPVATDCKKSCVGVANRERFDCLCNRNLWLSPGSLDSFGHFSREPEQTARDPPIHLLQKAHVIRVLNSLMQLLIEIDTH